MFKIGDIVRCKTDRYGITTYKRPCEVVEFISDDKINVRCLDSDSSIYDVDTNLFELVPLYEILHKGDDISNKRYPDIKYTFEKYGRYGIKARNKIMGYLETIPFEDILYQLCFKV